MMRPLLLLLLLTGCKATPDALSSDCGIFAGQYALEYVGGAFGKGTLELSLPADGSRTDVLEGRLVLNDETGTNARLELFGPASCDHDLVHLTFGAGDHPEAKVRVLGGVGTIVPARGRVEAMFGAWEVTAVIKADGREKRLSGFLREEKRKEGES